MNPPRIARRLWRTLAPERIAEDALEDLDEEYRGYQLPQNGRLRAGLWYWIQVLGALAAVHTRYRQVLRSQPGHRGSRGTREGEMIGGLMQDVRTALRTLIHVPSFTAFAVVTLAIGVGATSAIFSVVDAVLLSPLPYERSDELVVVGGRRADRASELLRVSGPEYADLLHGTSLDGVGAAYVIDANLTGGERPERVAVALVTHDFFPLLGIAPALGRDFEPEDAGVDIGYVVVLSHGAWQRMYGGDPAAIGSTVELDEDPLTVIGVMPEGFRHPAQPPGQPIDAWVPFDPTAALFGSRQYRPLDVYARLGDRATLEQARSEMRTLAEGYRELYPGDYGATGEWDLDVVPLLDHTVGDVRATLAVLLGAVVFVLLVACTNVAILLLARASARTQEFAVRSALGAGRARLARLALTESLVIGLAGGVAGLAIAVFGTDGLALLAAADFPRVGDASIDGRVLLFTLILSLAASTAFGLAPIMRVSRPNLREATARGGIRTSGRRSRSRDALVVIQIAVSLVLVIGAGLMVKSFDRLLTVDPGFDPEGVLSMQLWLPRPNVPETGRFFTMDQRVALFDHAIARMEDVPGVERAAVVSRLPLRGSASGPFTFEGEETGGADGPARVEVRTVSPGYFDVMGIRLTRGRGFSLADDGDGTATALVDEALADAYAPDRDPLGRRLQLGNGPWLEVVGVVSNVRHQTLDTSPRPTVYLSYRQGVGRSMAFVLETSGPPAAMARPAADALHEVDADLPLYGIQSMEDVVADTVAQRRTLMLLLSMFALQALVLAVIGVYGVIAYAARQRRREIGIRLALGAERRRVVWTIVGHGAALGLAGVTLGSLGAIGATRSLQGFLFEVGRLDPTVYGGMGMLWLGLAALAAFVPARTGSRVDPAETIRNE